MESAPGSQGEVQNNLSGGFGVYQINQVTDFCGINNPSTEVSVNAPTTQGSERE